MARTHRNIGNIYRQTGKAAETLAEWDRALPIHEALLRGTLPRSTGRADLTGRSDPSLIIREDLGMSFSEAGLLSAVSTFTYALGQIPAGLLADRFG